MSYLIDSNIISEIRKVDRASPNVAAWYASIEANDLYLSVLVLGEIRKGLEQARRTSAGFASELETWLGSVSQAFGDRVLPVDQAVADQWGRLNAIRTVPVIDGMLAATAKVYGLTLVTRNVSDVEGLGVKVLNPYDFPLG
ncbi:MAG: type II toxin-antitoxin system VapC family toxin [Microvirga sp.]